MNKNQTCRLFKAVASVLLFATGVAFAPPGLAQQAASDMSPIELIVPWGTGGGADRLGRKVANLLGTQLHTTVNVVNIPGATGNHGMARLLKGPSDGHHIALVTSETYGLLAYLNPGWNAKDVLPLCVMNREPSALFVAAGSPYRTWSDLKNRRA